MHRCRGSSPVERGPEKAGVASPILALGTIHIAAVTQKVPVPDVLDLVFVSGRQRGFVNGASSFGVLVSRTRALLKKSVDRRKSRRCLSHPLNREFCAY